MTRNLKALGLALVAALALGAIGAQGASAVVEHSFNSDVNNTVLTGTNEGNHVFRAGTGGASVSCSVATFSGTNSENPSDKVTVHPKYSSCTAFGANATVHTDGCNYIFDSDTTTGSHFAGEHATVSVECEKNAQGTPTHSIKVTGPGCTLIFSDTHPHGTKINQSIHGVQYTNLDSAPSVPAHSSAAHSSKSSITVNATAGLIRYVAEDSGGIGCNLAGIGDGTKTNGIYEGKAIVTGYEDSTHLSGSTTTGTTWNHSAQVNIWVSGTP